MVDTNHNRKNASLNWKDRGMIPKKISIRYSISQPSSSLHKKQSFEKDANTFAVGFLGVTWSRGLCC